MDFKDSFQIKKATAIYKEDLSRLEELIKADDIPGDYSMKFGDAKYLKYTFGYLIDGVRSTHDYTSIADISSEYENEEINFLDIEKQLYAEDSWKHKILIKMDKNHIIINIWGDNIRWVKTKRLLLEDYFENQKLNSNKFNYWIAVKLEKYLPLIGGALLGPGLASIFAKDIIEGFELHLYISLILGTLLILLSFFLVSSSFRSKFFPVNKISLQEKPKEQERNKIKSWLINGLSGLVWSFIFYMIVNFFLN